MTRQNINADIEMTAEDQDKLARIVSALEDTSPSDASVFLRLERIADKYVGSLKIRSFALRVDLAEENFDMDALLDILNNECKDQIDEWKKNRKI